MITKKLMAIACLSLLLSGTAAAQKLGDSAETDMVIKLEGLSAACSMNDVKLRMTTPERASAATISKALNTSAKCVDDGLPKGQEIYRHALSAAPSSKPMLAPIYSHWLGFMKALSAYHDTDGQNSAEQALDASVHDMQAELDSRPVAGR